MTDSASESTIKKIARGTADSVAYHSDNVLWRFAEHIPLLNLLVARRERAVAREQCGVLLRLCRAVQGEHKGIAGEALYEKVIERRLLCDETKARQIVRLADQSFAQWPEERDVNFRDIVNYVIVHQIMTQHSRAMGILVDMEKLVGEAIPAGL